MELQPFPEPMPITTAKTTPNFKGNDYIQAIANVAAFHFGQIEQGGSSLYPAMSQKVTDPEVLEITLGIGGDEIVHFLEWVDFSGNGVQAPIAPFTDSISGLTISQLFQTSQQADLAQSDLPRPCRIQAQPPPCLDHSSANRSVCGCHGCS
jgi:hypothetical protein